ncbi:MAG TPA: glycosyltransferase [Flavobacteriales bacterium]|nr:glycosyltransferase [Flavobacteriales bacterium]
MIFILLPAYNEEVSFDALLPKIDNYFKNELQIPYHLIICDDGSTDSTLEILKSYQEKLPLTIIHHKINRGLGETSRDLFEKAVEISEKDDIFIRMDCDDTHEPEFIKGMIDKIHEGNDVAIASRFVEGGSQEGLEGYRKILSLLANKFMKLFFPIKGLKEYSSGFRAYRADVMKIVLNTYGNNFIQLKGLGFTCTLEKMVKLKMIGAKFGEAPFVLRYQKKMSDSKMVASVTTLGYIILVILYYWPFGGWRSQAKKITKLHS